MSLFIDVEVDASARSNADLVKKLVEVCPVNIFAASSGKLDIVDAHLDECTLCELCLNAAPPGSVKVKRLYGTKDVLVRQS
ncbi:MAG: ferredoxin [Deltaproteobacteria bacterium]|nr:ferredoxin [Deltaproteobacteria bacterium]